MTYVSLTSAYANLGRTDEARAMLLKVRELSPICDNLIEKGRAKRDTFADVVAPAFSEGRPT